MLVVIGVTALIAGTMITYSYSSRIRTELFVEQAKIAQLVSRAKSLAITTFVVNNRLPCGYGVHFDYSSGIERVELYRYDSYVDVNGFDACDPLDRDVVGVTEPSRRFVFENESYAMKGNARISPASTGGDGLADVIFLPPRPQARLFWRDPAYSNSEGEINIRAGSETLSIFINSAGQISF